MFFSLMPLWAVHLPDNYINLDLTRPLDGWPWVVGGFIVTAVLAWWGSRCIRDEEIPMIALMTAAFTVASGLHVPIGPSSVHLILNGLLGVVLGRRSALAIPVGLFLQAVAGHGGFTTLGINGCVMLLPALAAAGAVRTIDSMALGCQSWFRSALMGTTAFVLAMSLAFGIVLITANFKTLETPNIALDDFVRNLPIALPLSILLAVAAILAERRLNPPPEFAVGFLVGAAAILLTVSLCVLVMLCAGPANSGAKLYALLLFVSHLPLAVAEGVVAGFLLAYLAKVKPEMIRPTHNVRAGGEAEIASTAVLESEKRGAERCPADSGS
jgi:cobalt/nickel transport system permease protein